MSSDLWYGLGCVALGGVTLMDWWFEMFSDSGYAQLSRSFMDQPGFYMGRNTIALLKPAIGSMFVFGGGLFFVQVSDDDISIPGVILTVGVVLSMVLSLIALIPFPLPRPMYPEWQMEKRRRRRAEAGRGDQNRADAVGHGAAGVPAEEAHRRWETSGPGGSNRRTG